MKNSQKMPQEAKNVTDDIPAEVAKIKVVEQLDQ